MKWISVKDKFPKPIPGQRTLVTDGVNIALCDWIYWPPWTWILPKEIQKVSHWMPLPELPNDN